MPGRTTPKTATHEVESLAPPLVDYNLYETNRCLSEAVRRERARPELCPVAASEPAFCFARAAIILQVVIICLKWATGSGICAAFRFSPGRVLVGEDA